MRPPFSPLHTPYSQSQTQHQAITTLPDYDASSGIHTIALTPVHAIPLIHRPISITCDGHTMTTAL
jgi:hypothetical protein